MNQQMIESAIRDRIQKSVDAEKEEIIKAAVSEFEKHIRATVGRIAIDLSNYFSVERMGADLVIRVRIETGAKP